MLLDVFNYTFAAIMIGISVAWALLIKTMIDSFRHTPVLDKFDQKPHNSPRVSVILPARNEENFIQKCLESLTAQDYPNYEIIAIDDSSEDSTAKIIAQYAYNQKCKDTRSQVHKQFYAGPIGWPH